MAGKEYNRVEGDEDKRLLIGFDTKANPIEILYNELGDNGVNVFHAMACQSCFLLKHIVHYSL